MHYCEICGGDIGCIRFFGIFEIAECHLVDFVSDLTREFEEGEPVRRGARFSFLFKCHSVIRHGYSPVRTPCGRLGRLCGGTGLGFGPK